jgi:hypothetical protein
MPNEKTLELNITHEILEMCRQYDPLACSIGTTLIQESHLGYDSRVLSRFSLSWVTSPLQYKRAKRRVQIGKNVFQYVFDINNNTYHDQHLILFHNLAGGRKRVAYYALPALFTDREFANSLPHLLNNTFFIDVASIPSHMVDFQTHQILLDSQRRIAWLSSEEKEVKAISREEFQGLVAERQIGASISMILENMKSPPKDNLAPKSKRPRFLFNIVSTKNQKLVYR